MKQSEFSILIRAIVLAVMLSLAGCSGILIHQAIDKGQIPSAAQIKEINETGHKLFMCLYAAGPPGGGVFLFIMVPKDSPVTVKFGEACKVQP
jgi:hypothetical protein